MLYREMTEEDARKLRNNIVTLGQEAIKILEMGGTMSAIAETIEKQKRCKELLEKWEQWQKIKDCDLSDLL